MSEKIIVPTLGESVTEATVSKWLKSQGETVVVDEPIVELQTDKVNVEVPSPISGVLSEMNSKDGDTVEVGAVLGSISEGKLNVEKKVSLKQEKEVETIEEDKILDTNKPHIFSTAELAYKNINKSNQAILVSGESGSGKTENTKYILRYLSNNYGINDNISKNIILCNIIKWLIGFVS